MKKVLYLAILLVLFFVCIFMDKTISIAKGGKAMELSSTAFHKEGMIPDKYTCDWADG